MDNDEVVTSSVLKASFEQDGRVKLTCADAFKLAEQLKVDLLEIARVCNQRKIKICKCQLGCFK